MGHYCVLNNTLILYFDSVGVDAGPGYGHKCGLHKHYCYKTHVCKCDHGYHPYGKICSKYFLNAGSDTFTLMVHN